MIPSLANLPIGETLFEYLARNRGGKGDCFFHEEPVTNENRDGNCAADGYLMHRELTGTVSETVEANPAKIIDVSFYFNGIPIQIPMLPMGRFKVDRPSNFVEAHKDFVENQFSKSCRRPDGVSVTWTNYGYHLARMSEHYHIDDKGRGHLFVCTLQTDKKKNDLHLPKGDRCAKPYLYIALVCSDVGYGKLLMQLATAFAELVGCSGIVLSSLTNSAGFYFSQGYRFINTEGSEVPVNQYVDLVRRADGSTKPFLNTTSDPGTAPIPEESSKSEKGAGRSRDESGGTERRSSKRRAPVATHNIVSFVSVDGTGSDFFDPAPTTAPV